MNLLSIELPDILTSIGEFAFCQCGKLTTFIIPVSLKSIGEQAFVYCNNLKELIIENEENIKRNYLDKNGNYSIIGLKPGAYKVKYYNSNSKTTSEIKTINIIKIILFICHTSFLMKLC